MLPLDESEPSNFPNNSLLQDIIATVLDITVTAWKEVLRKEEICATSSEPDIAGCLGRAMIIEKNKRPGIKSQLRIEEEVGTRSSPEITRTDGRIDIKIIYSFDEAEYFGMECKRVSSKDSRLAKQYILGGMMRFVTGKYGLGHNWGALLAFVIDGNPAESVNLICRQLINYHRRTHMKSNWIIESGFGTYEHLYHTRHQQYSQKSLMTILHFFLSIAAIASETSEIMSS